jgi:putative sterol carrier protein
LTIDQIIALVRKKASAFTTGVPDASMQVNITGEGGGQFYARYEGGIATIEPGMLDDAKLRVSIDIEDVIAALEGKADPMGLYFRGKLKVSGDLGLAMQLRHLF